VSGFPVHTIELLLCISCGFLNFFSEYLTWLLAYPNRWLYCGHVVYCNRIAVRWWAFQGVVLWRAGEIMRIREADDETISPSQMFVEENNDGNRPSAEASAGQDVDDSVLVKAAQQGDGEAFGVLVDQYHGQVYGLIARMCGPAAADDLTQDVFLKALKALRRFQFQGEASFRTWLYRIGVNEAINELRQRKRRRQVMGPSLDEPVITDDGYVQRQLGDTTEEPYRLTVQNELQRVVHEVLGMLTEKQRTALVLIDLQGLTYEEAAGVLDCPLGTLKSRLVRARGTFAEKFRQHQPQWTPTEVT